MSTHPLQGTKQTHNKLHKKTKQRMNADGIGEAIFGIKVA